MAVMALPSPIAYRALRPCVQAEVIDPVATAAQNRSGIASFITPWRD